MVTLTILVIDDEAEIRRELSDFLRTRGHAVLDVGLPSEAFALMHERKVDVVVIDIKLPEMNGFAVLDRIREEFPGIESIMITGHGDSTTVLEALRHGAFDFFHKPLMSEDIEAALMRTRAYISVKSRAERMTRERNMLAAIFDRTVGDIVGESASIRAVVDLAVNAASAPGAAVMITGESGTGKELVARAMHSASDRRAGAFHTLNCSAIPLGLIESELFGHKKGSFTGAIEDRIGCFEAADGGTLFLDEIGDMPLEAQAKLLRALENRVIRRVGEQKDIAVDVRVVSATNKDVRKAIAEGSFRQDLYYRLNAFVITVPPLRERPEDIPLLVDHFAAHYAMQLKRAVPVIERSAYDLLARYSFPGNIRELRNMVERAMILCDGTSITDAYFSAGEGPSPLRNEHPADDVFDLEAVEKNAIIRALRRTEGNQGGAARLLGLSDSTLSRKIHRYGIEYK